MVKTPEQEDGELLKRIFLTTGDIHQAMGFARLIFDGRFEEKWGESDHSNRWE